LFTLDAQIQLRLGSAPADPAGKAHSVSSDTLAGFGEKRRERRKEWIGERGRDKGRGGRRNGKG